MKKKICIREYHLQCSRTLGKPGKLRLAFLTDLHNRTEGEEGRESGNFWILLRQILFWLEETCWWESREKISALQWIL